MTATALSPAAQGAAETGGLAGWLLTRDHKRIGIMVLVAGFLMFLFDGVLGLMMRAQLAQPDGHILDAQQYNEFFTMHGTGMIAVSITPFSSRTARPPAGGATRRWPTASTRRVAARTCGSWPCSSSRPA